MKILNLFAGLGGNRRTWSSHEITAVDFNPKIVNIYKKLYPNDLIIEKDVFDYLQEIDLLEYDFIWSSPPCQSHSHMQVFTKNGRKAKLPMINQVLGLALWLKKYYPGPFVVENVVPWYGILKTNKLFTVVIDRHLFYSNFKILPKSFDKGNNRHGSIGGIMRESREYLMNKHHLPNWILEDLSGVHDKDQIIRNCVDSKIGDYVLKQSQRLVKLV